MGGPHTSASAAALELGGSAHPPRWLVAVGSSAGGIEALSAFLQGLGDLSDLAVVIAQHLSPTHASPLAELLARESGLEVAEAHDGQSLAAGAVYIAPSRADITVVEGSLTVVSSEAPTAPRPSIDGLLRTVAREWGDHAVGVLLSGTGTDGRAGMETIKSAGGVTIAQDPTTAKFPAMPRAAIATGAVDLVAPPEEIGALIERACKPADDQPGAPSDEWSAEAVADLLDAVRTITGVDFSEYKVATLMRQIARRQTITGIVTPADYCAAVVGDPDEAHALMRRMCVSVSSFFRDPAAWDALTAQIDAIVAKADAAHQIRIWVPGCATGEEAYSVAMLVAEALGRPADLTRKLRIFASDLDEAALEVARLGRYDAFEAPAIPADLRATWMDTSGRDLEVKRVLRECIVFAHHDMTVDPPFSHLDLISLRNTMIYFQPALQERLLRLCHFALGQGGILFLGEAESVSGRSDLFAPLDTDHSIYVRTATTTLGPLPTRSSNVQRTVTAQPASRGSERSRRQILVLNDVLKMWAPPLLVVNAADEVVQVVGDVSPWCWVADGPYTSQVTTLMRDDLQPIVTSLLLRLHHGHGSRHARRVATPEGPVEITAQRLDGSDQVFAVISFDAHADDAATSPVDATVTEEATLATSGMISEAEFLEAHDDLQETIEDLTATNQEMQALNEELQVRSAELEATNLDLENIQHSLDTGIILLDPDLRIRHFNALAVRLFALIEGDLGRALTSVATTAAIPQLDELLHRVAVSGGSEHIEVSGETADYLLRLQPYVDAAGRQHGVTLTVTDVSSRASVRRRVDQSLAELEHVVESIDELLWMIDDAGALLLLGPQVTAMYGLDHAAVLAQPSLLDLAVHLDDRSALAALNAADGGRWRAEFRIHRPDGAIRWISGSSRRIHAKPDGPTVTIRTALDVTDRHDIEDRSLTRLHLFESVFNTEVFGVIAVDADGVISTCNPTFADMVSSTPDLLTGRPLETLVSFDSNLADRDSSWLDLIGEASAGDHRLVSSTGMGRWVVLDVRPVPSVDGQEAAAIIIVDEVTQLRETEQRLTRGAHIDDQTGIANRAWFHSRLEEELARSARSGTMIALASIDLDGFKEVNDQYGHAAGDLVLRAVADRLRALGRRQDVVGRIGGDEFALLIGGIVEEREASAIAERALGEMRSPIDIGVANVALTASIGIALSPLDGRDAATLLHSADVAMYHAKRSGRDGWSFYSAQMNATATNRAEQRQLLSEAIRSEQFTMRYQPIVAVADGQIFAAESLVRWQQGDELIEASAFISLAEETYQLRGLGHLIMGLLSTDLASLAAEHDLTELSICMNLSVSQLEEPELINRLLSWDLLGGFNRLIVEVTENALLEPDGTGVRTLTLLRGLGATICIDDFGSGYANFGQIEASQPDIIKFDETLLHRARLGADGRALVSSFVELVRAMGAKVVFEGVESKEDLELATVLGAELVQGYDIARPMSVADLGLWVSHHAAHPQDLGSRLAPERFDDRPHP